MENYTLEMLQEMTCKQLLQIAKNMQITGRHNLKKSELIAAILLGVNALLPVVKEALEIVSDELKELAEKENITFEEAIEKALEAETLQPKRDIKINRVIKDRYARTVALGTIVAFNVGEKMLSGKIIEIHQDKFRIETKRGVKFLVDKSEVAWFKTGQRWPRGIFDELTKGRAKTYGQ